MLIGVALVLLLVMWSSIVIYNRINPLRHQVDASQANIEVAMQKRLRLADDLLGVARRFARHEALIHLQVSADRRVPIEHYQRSRQAIAFVAQLADTFPALKADQAYNRLMHELSQLEADLQGKYESHNAVALLYNESRTRFPAVLLSGVLGFGRVQYLDPSLWHPH